MTRPFVWIAFHSRFFFFVFRALGLLCLVGLAGCAALDLPVKNHATDLLAPFPVLLDAPRISALDTKLFCVGVIVALCIAATQTGTVRNWFSTWLGPGSMSTASADNSVALSNYLASGGGLLPPGTYTFTKPVIANVPTTLKGFGSLTRLNYTGPSNVYALTFAGGNSQVSDLSRVAINAKVGAAEGVTALAVTPPALPVFTNKLTFFWFITRGCHETGIVEVNPATGALREVVKLYASDNPTNRQDFTATIYTTNSAGLYRGFTRQRQ